MKRDSVEDLIKKKRYAEAIEEINRKSVKLRDEGEFDRAIKLSKQGSELATQHRLYLEGSYCCRLLAEIHAQRDERAQSLQYIAEFRQMAKKSNSQSQLQLSYHVEAWCLLQLFQSGSADSTDLEEAIEASKTSRELVDKFRSKLTTDEGGSPKSRKIALKILEAQIYESLGNVEMAMQVLDEAGSQLSDHDKALRYELVRTKCSIAPISQRVQLAELLVEDAPEDKKAVALAELAHQFVLSIKLERGFEEMIMMLISHKKKISNTDRDDVEKRAAIMWRLMQYEEELKRAKSKMSRCELHEAIGDLYDKYYQSLLPKEKFEYKQFVRGTIVDNYNQMLEHRRDEKDALRAYLALALVHFDLGEFDKAMEYFAKRLELLNKCGAGAEKVLDCEVSIFGCKIKKKSAGLQFIFDDLDKRIQMNCTRKELYESWAAYWRDRDDIDKEKIWSKKADEIPDVQIKNEDDETDLLFRRLTDAQIVERMVAENSHLRVRLYSDYEISNRNKEGETKLHEAAKTENNEREVEELCKRVIDQGANVNVMDHAGWTPLSEAVVHGRLGNARVLIKYGADVNCVSRQSYENTDDGHTGLTPLMESCSSGSIQMARLLISNKARLGMRDSSKWTAYDHFRNFIDQLDETNEEQRDFEKFLREETGNCGPSIQIPVKRTRVQESVHDDTFDDEEESMILGVGASRKRRNPSVERVNIPKRRAIQQRRSSPSPPPVIIPTPQSASPSNRPAAATHPFFAQRTVRTSTSPAQTVRSAPSIRGADEDDEIEIIGTKKSKIQRKSLSPFRSVPQSSSTSVKCSFQVPSGFDGSFKTVKLPMDRTLSILEVKQRIVDHIKNPQLKIAFVTSDGDSSCLLSDDLLLSHLHPTNDLHLIFQLEEPHAHEIYEKMKDPIAEVTQCLKKIQSDQILDFSKIAIFLEDDEFLALTALIKKAQKPKNVRVDLTNSELTRESERNLQPIVEEAVSLKIGSTISQDGFLELFTKPLEKLETLAISNVALKEDQMGTILKQCRHLKTLKLKLLRIPGGPSPRVAQMIAELPNLETLYVCKLEGANAEFYGEVFTKSDRLKQLHFVDENASDLKMEFGMLPNIECLSVKGSLMDWDSFFEYLSVLPHLSRVDFSHTSVPSNLVDELRQSVTALTIVNN